MAGKKDIVEQALKLIAQHFNENAVRAAAEPVYKSRERVTYITPDQFLQLARPLDNGPNAEKLEALRKSISSGEKLHQIPFLNFTHEGDIARITGHEGRHRALALKEAGAEQMPVIMRSDRIRWSEQADPNRFDYVKDWPSILKSETGENTIPFPIERPTEADGGPIREGYGPGGIIDDVVKLAGRVISGEGDEAAQAGIRAYHGSPHDFDKFDMSKIGTGEGAQAYGHGLYFAGNEDVAKGYRRNLSGPESMGTVTFDGRPIVSGGSPAEGWDDPNLILGGDIHARDLAETMLRHHGNVDAAVSELRGKSQSGFERAQTVKNEKLRQMAVNSAKTASDMADLLQANPDRYGVKIPGHMYEVNIAADPNTFLDWDKPLSEQIAGQKIIERDLLGPVPPQIEIQAKHSGVDPRELQKSILGEMTGSEILKSEAGNYGGQKSASNRLKEIGIPGIKYLDAGSRGAGDGTRNYVVFDDKLISIIRKYGIAGASAMLGYNLMENLDSNQARAATAADTEYNEREKRAGGGKAVKEALRIAAEGLESLAKDKGQTPEQLLKGFANQKPRVPYEEWRYEFEPTAELLPSKEFNPESLKPGDVIIPLVGDRTSTGRKITSIAGTPLETPAITEGGPDYMRGPSQRGDKSVWASGKGVISQLEGRIDRALKASEAKGYKDPNVYGSYVAMGPQSGDFSTHTAEAIMGMMPSAKIKRADAKEFDSTMRERFPDWPGIMSPKAADYVINANAGEHRKAFIDAMDTAYWRDRGFPDASLARYATATPELVAAPTEAAGYNIARITPSEKPEVITRVHRSYPSTMHGEYVGGLPAGLTRDELFTQFSRGFDADPPARNYVMAKRRSFGMDPNAFQVMEGQDIEDLIRKVTALKNEYAAGGEVDDDDDVNDALRIAKDVGGGTPVMMEDAKGNKYDAQGNVIPQDNTGPNPQRTEAAPQQNVMFNTAPQNYSQDVQPFIDYAVTPIDRPGTPSEPDLVNVMRIATQVAAQGQPTDDRGQGNFARRRSETVRSLAGASPEGYQSDYKGPFTYNAGDTADFLNTLIDFSPYGALEYAHDIPYEAGRTGDYGTAAVEGGLGALMTAPGIALAGRGIKKGYELAKQFPKLTAGAIGAGAATTGSDEAEAGPARWFSKAVEAARAIPMNKMTGEQALAMLRKGTSPEELRWMGAEDFLSGQKSVSKDDLVAFLEKNRVQPTEITLGGGGKPTRREDVRPDADIVAKYVGMRDNAYKEYNEINQQIKQAVDLEQWGKVENLKLLASDKYREYNGLTERMIDEQIARMGGLGRPTKYHDYSTPGGESYQENLYQFGVGERPQVKEIDGMFSIVGPNGEVMRSETGKPYTYWSEADANRAAKSIYRTSGDYTSSHWDEPNILFHTRSQTLNAIPPGADRPYKAHNVDEVQSDLGQAGRKSGFREKDYEPRLKQVNAELFEAEGQYKVRQAALDDNYRQQYKKISDLSALDERAFSEAVRRGEMKPREFEEAVAGLVEKYRPMTKPILEKYSRDVSDLQETLGNRINALKQERANLNIEQSKMPAKPFVGSTEGWTDRAIKSELDKALDNNAEYFTWTPGDVHADRYNLTNYIDEVAYDPIDQRLQAFDTNGDRVVSQYDVSPSDLDSYVGKEIADKLKNQDQSMRDNFAKEWTITEEPDGQFSIRRNGESGWGEYPSMEIAKERLNETMVNSLYREPISLSGLDLKVGGEGMRGYYDNVYPKRVQEVIRKATGQKPVIEIIEVQTADGPRNQLGVRLTDEMREKARFSDFKKGGRVTGGTSYDSNPTVDTAIALTREY